MTRLSYFTFSILKEKQVDPTIKIWLHGTRDLERRLGERVLFLCRYCDRMPKPLLPEYADLLLETLSDKNFKEYISISKQIYENISKLAELLEQSGDPKEKERAKQIRRVAVTP
jgi:hypothetical protein